MNAEINGVRQMSPEITLIKKCGPSPVMSKRLFLNEGKICGDSSQCLMARGSAQRVAAETASDLARHISSCGPEQAIALGSLRADLPSPIAITTSSRLRENPGAVTRSREYIDYVHGRPAWALIDFDVKGVPSHVAATIDAAGGMWNALLTVAPGLRRAARVARASTSSGLYRTAPEAEAHAFECCVVDWLNRHPCPSTSTRCAQCGGPGSSSAVVLPFGTEPGTHVWLHAECWAAWQEARRGQAVKALALMGINPPVPSTQGRGLKNPRATS